jgi:sarcosine oxidase subunit alpha
LPDREGESLPGRDVEARDVVVVGAGPAGLAAATAAAHAGARVLLCDDDTAPGGSLHAEAHGGTQARALLAAAQAAGVEVWSEARVLGFYPDHGGVMVVARAAGLWRLAARVTIVATGGHEQNLLFSDNDRPGVLAARAAGRLLHRFGVRPGERVAIAHDGGRAAPYATRLADGLAAAKVACSVIGPPATIARSTGGKRLSGIVLTDGTKVPCDALAVARAAAPASELARQMGAQVTLDTAGGGFRVVPDPGGRFAPGRWVCGDVTGYRGPAAAAEDGGRVGRAALEKA